VGPRNQPRRALPSPGDMENCVLTVAIKGIDPFTRASLNMRVKRVRTFRLHCDFLTVGAFPVRPPRRPKRIAASQFHSLADAIRFGDDDIHAACSLIWM